ncbi:MAG: FAD binding domain-containing protein [Bradyrhizobiaceae bacterium]|nr:FAD binding domain-containing protein [Hyphomicrobiales bacterium]MBV9428182.1 FAD binding domain-containing protein [Bradyrhizobiaceae bacterium]
MKPAPFELARPANLAEAAAALAQNLGEARLLAGGQSLGPMLNLRLVRPAMLVAIAHLPELGAVAEDADAVTIGAAVTHAAIADGRTPDVGNRILARIADGIAYRAVRNLGTIGGSLCHGDPAADWLTTLTALGASAITWSKTGGRAIPLAHFITGAFRTALAPGEIVQAVRVPRPSSQAHWGYYKACRKPGEFAHAMAAVLDDSARGVRRAVIGAAGGPPVVLEGEQVTPVAAGDALRTAGLDAVARHMQAVALKRALAEAVA